MKRWYIYTKSHGSATAATRSLMTNKLMTSKAIRFATTSCYYGRMIKVGVKKAELFPKTDRRSKHAVIFVHGLHGDPNDSWRQRKSTKTFPELLALDKDMHTIDIYSFGYPSNLILNYDFREVSKILYSEIKAHLNGKDIFFVAHSMGGLVVQQFLVDQFEMFHPEVAQRVKGIVYLAVPFNGSTKANLFSWLLPFHKQVHSLMTNNPALDQLRTSWAKYVYRGGDERLPDTFRVNIPQIAIYGVRDRIVSKNSASSFHIGATVIPSDTGHKHICKIDQFSTEYKHIKDFIIEKVSSKIKLMIVHIHGWAKQRFPEEAHYHLDWTRHFKISPTTRILPHSTVWEKEILPEVESLANEWSEKGGVIRIYSKLCLTGALLIGSRLSFTKGVKLEVEHYGQIWMADKYDTSYNVIPKTTFGNLTGSPRAILILSVRKNIQTEVEQYLNSTQQTYKKLVNLLPPNGAGPESIQNSIQALSYALSVKEEIEKLKTEGVKEIFLFLNTPLSVAFFVGHRLTASCPIITFEFNGIDYTFSSKI